MRKLKFKPTDKTVDFFNQFSVIDDLSVEKMLTRILCAVSNQDPTEAAIIVLWYAIVGRKSLDNRQTTEVFLSVISSLICCTINDKFSLEDALETLTLSYQDITKTDAMIGDKDFEKEFRRSLPEQIVYGKRLKVQAVSSVMNIKKYSRQHGIPIEQIIENQIEEMSPNNLKMVQEMLFQRVIYATLKQNQIQICGTIFLLSAFLISYIRDFKDSKPFEWFIEEIRNECTENMRTSYKYSRIEKLKEKIHRNKRNTA